MWPGSKIALAGNLAVKNCLVGCNLQPAGTSMWGSDCEQLGAATSFYTFPGTIPTVISGDLTWNGGRSVRVRRLCLLLLLPSAACRSGASSAAPSLENKRIVSDSERNPFPISLVRNPASPLASTLRHASWRLPSDSLGVSQR